MTDPRPLLFLQYLPPPYNQCILRYPTPVMFYIQSKCIKLISLPLPLHLHLHFSTQGSRVSAVNCKFASKNGKRRDALPVSTCTYTGFPRYAAATSIRMQGSERVVQRFRRCLSSTRTSSVGFGSCLYVFSYTYIPVARGDTLSETTGGSKRHRNLTFGARLPLAVPHTPGQDPTRRETTLESELTVYLHLPLSPTPAQRYYTYRERVLTPLATICVAVIEIGTN